MGRIKISHATQDNVRGGKSLTTALVLTELFSTPGGQDDGRPNEEELVVDHLMISKSNHAQQLVKVIQSQAIWKRIRFKYSGGEHYGSVIQVAVEHSETLEIAHRSYDDIRWNFSLDFTNSRDFHCLHLTGCNFHQPETINSISHYLGNPLSSVRKVNLHGCKFLHPETFPIFTQCLRENTSLERLWMARCELSDSDIASLVNSIQGHSTLSELGLSYNNCGAQGSIALANFLLSNPRLRVLYLNKQQGEMDLEAIINAFNKSNSIEKINLAQNYAEDISRMTEVLNNLIDPSRRKQVDLQALTSQLTWIEIKQTTESNSRKLRVPRSMVTSLSEEELTKLQDACQYIKESFQKEEKPLAVCSSYLQTIMDLGENIHEWLAKFLRKSVKGDIKKLRPLIETTPRTDSESKLLQQVWRDIEDFDRIFKREKTQKKIKKKVKLNKFVPISGDNNTLVKVAYDCMDAPFKNGWLEKHDCPFLRLPRLPIFVDSILLLKNIQQQLATCKLVGVDSEWSSKSIATLQIAFLADEGEGGGGAIRSFVIDLLSVVPDFQKAVKVFIRWLFGKDTNICILGFAFGGDLQKLQDFVGEDGSALLTDSTILDIQLLLAVSSDYGMLPGLKRCTQKYFKKPLSKGEQCSNWAHRPLSIEQLHYAGLDAAILLALLYNKKREELDR